MPAPPAVERSPFPSRRRAGIGDRPPRGQRRAHIASIAIVDDSRRAMVHRGTSFLFAALIAGRAGAIGSAGRPGAAPACNLLPFARGARRAGAPAAGGPGGAVHVHLEEGNAGRRAELAARISALAGALDPVDAWRAWEDDLAEAQRRSRAAGATSPQGQSSGRPARRSMRRPSPIARGLPTSSARAPAQSPLSKRPLPPSRRPRSRQGCSATSTKRRGQAQVRGDARQ